MSVRTLQTVTVPAGYTLATPLVTLEFVADAVRLYCFTAGVVIAYSFDGTNDHGLLGPGASLPFDVRTERWIKRIWFKQLSGGAATVYVGASSIN